jgi:hypothetical protein
VAFQGHHVFGRAPVSPFRSKAQRRFLYAKHPAVAAEFEAATPKGKRLPEKVKPKPKTKRGKR